MKKANRYNAILKISQPPEGLITKQIDFTVTKIDEENRVIDFVGSDETEDRAGDILRVAGWDTKEYMKNPVFLFAHNYRDLPVGKAIDVNPDLGSKQLRFKIQFPSADEYAFGNTVYKMYRGGYIRAVSVGFKPIASEERRDANNNLMMGRDYTKQQLLELSAVSVPCNPNALMTGVGKGEFSDAEVSELVKCKMISPEELAKTKSAGDAPPADTKTKDAPPATEPDKNAPPAPPAKLVFYIRNEKGEYVEATPENLPIDTKDPMVQLVDATKKAFNDILAGISQLDDSIDELHQKVNKINAEPEAPQKASEAGGGSGNSPTEPPQAGLYDGLFAGIGKAIKTIQETNKKL